MPAEERSIRDRLAEALFVRAMAFDGRFVWSDLDDGGRRIWQIDADIFMLSTLPTVGLVLTSSEDTTQTRQDDGGGR